MQIIYQDLITSIDTNSTGSIGSDYTEAAVLNDFPKNPYIPDASTVTLTVLFGADTDSLFMTYLAESVSIDFYSVSSGGSPISGESLSYTNTYDMSDAYFFNDKAIVNSSIFAAVPAAAVRAEITLTNTSDKKNTINRFVYSGNAGLGQLFYNDESDNNSILFENNPQVKIGALVNGTYQVNRITGDGTGFQDVKLNGATADITITSIKLPIYINTLRAGKSITVYNPSVGLEVSSTHYGIQQQVDSSVSYRLGEVGRTFSGSVQILEAERTSIIRVLDGIRSKPVAVKVLDYQGEMAVFGAFLEGYSFSYSNQGSRIYDLSFSFTEIV